MRTIPKKNYFLVGLIALVTFLLTWYFVAVYQLRKDYDLDQNKRMNAILSEIHEEDLQNYILDNHDVMIYLSSSRDETYQSFEKSLIKYLKKEDLTKEIVYLDTSNLEEAFYARFMKNYVSEELQGITLQMIPNLVVLSDGKVTSILYPTMVEPNIQDVKNFLKGEV